MDVKKKAFRKAVKETTVDATTGRNSPVLVRCDPAFMKKLDAYAKKHEISRPEAMRRAAEIGFRE